MDLRRLTSPRNQELVLSTHSGFRGSGDNQSKAKVIDLDVFRLISQLLWKIFCNFALFPKVE